MFIKIINNKTRYFQCYIDSIDISMAVTTVGTKELKNKVPLKVHMVLNLWNKIVYL